MAVADRTGSAAYRRQGSSSYRNPSNASYATASNPYSSRYSAFKARGLAAAKQQGQTPHGDVSAHGSGYLQDVAYILNDDSGYQDEGDAAASSVSRAAGVARDRAINHFINKADLSEYHLDQPLPATNTGKLSSGVVSTGYQMPNAGTRTSQSFHFRRAQGNAAAAQSGNAMLSGSQAAASLAPVPYAAAASGTAIQTSVQTAKGWNSFSGMQHAAAQMPAAGGRHLQQGVQPLPAAKLPKPSQSTVYSWQQRYAAQQSQKVAARRPSAHRLAATLKPQYQLRNQGLPVASHTARGQAAVSGPAVTRTISREAYGRIRQDCMAHRAIMAKCPQNALLRHAARSIGMQKSLQIARTGSIYHVANVSRGRTATASAVRLGRSSRRYTSPMKSKTISFKQQRSAHAAVRTPARNAATLRRATLRPASYAALPGKQVPQTQKTHVSAEHFGMKLHQGSGKRVVAHERNATGTGRHLRLAKIKKGAGKKRAEWLKRKSQPSLYARKQSSLTSAAKKAGRAYQKANKVIYTASLFVPDNAQDMGDAAASVPAKLMKETGRRVASKSLRAAKGKLAERISSRTKPIGTNPSIRRANVRTMRKAMAKNAAQAAASSAGSNVVEVHSVSDAVHNLVAVLKKVPSRIAGDIAALFGGAAAASLPGGVVAALVCALLIPALFLILLINIIIPSMGGTGALAGDAAEFAQFLKNDMGMNNAQVAAVIGNAVVESGNGRWTTGDPIVLSWGSLEGNGAGHGIFQWTGDRANALIALAQSQGKDWTDKDVQMQYFKSEWDSAWGLAQGSIDWYTDGEYSGVASKETFENETSVDMATLEFMAGWERPAKTVNGVPSTHWRNRVACAQYIYSALESAAGGTIDDGSLSASQQAVVSAACSTPSPGEGLCAGWVDDVFENAGIGVARDWSARDMYDKYCTSSNLDDLKPGMIIAVSTHNLDAAGRSWGHVGIYIGNGQVMDNIGSIRTEDVNQWIQTFSGVVPAKWGWLGNIPLT